MCPEAQKISEQFQSVSGRFDLDQKDQKVICNDEIIYT